MTDGDQALPERTHGIIGHVKVQDRHPGLQLDKLSVAANQQEQAVALKRVCDAARDEKLLAELLSRRALQFEKFQDPLIQFDAETSSPLTLYLARASALENAGICLHPLYGFAYLPASGLKGMARAYAETVWAPASGNGLEAWTKIERVFGWAPTSENRKRWRPDLAVPDGASAGSVVFHDAWPTRWPPLFVDIVNNHHSEYYAGNDAPGDWENPIPIYFLAVQSRATFSFTLSPRRPNTSQDELDVAREFLIGALTWFGAGAKTNAGYGCFRLTSESIAPQVTRQAPAPLVSETFDLELATPAFLAGASQSEQDCDLRPATLRGLLRWWWRTMHSGFVNLPTLRALEAAVWGSTEVGGAVRISVRTEVAFSPGQYDKIAIRDRYRLEKPRDRKTTQGLFYLSFGMDDIKREGGAAVARKRYFVPPGAKWRVTLTARQSIFQEINSDPESKEVVSATRIMEQAKTALWMFCHFGGAGSKSRKGFGSFDEPQALAYLTIPQCKGLAEAFRRDCGLTATSFNQSLSNSPSLEQLLPWEDTTLPWTDCWNALDQLGYAAQEFAKKYKHRSEKRALGLPRKIGPIEQGQFNPHSVIKVRHASPVHYHLACTQNGPYVARIAAFPASRLPNLTSSQTLLKELLSHLRDSLARRSAQPPESQRSSSRESKGPQKSNPFIPKTPRGGRSRPGGPGPKRR